MPLLTEQRMRDNAAAAEPTVAQIAAGNYRKGHIRFQGLDLAIENPKGSERRGTGADGKAWSVTMPAAYGYIKRTTGADDEQVDCYVGPDLESPDVWVIDQVVEGSTAFDEHKVMLGFSSKGEALAAYKAAFSDGKGADRIGRVAHRTIDEFKAAVAEGRHFTHKTFRADAAEPTFETPPEDATDHQVAEGIRDGKYASPQKYGDFWLFDLRVTGTGMAWRESIGEWAHRNPDTWLTDEFVQRCNGLPVIFGHPERSGLNSEEFAERAIGTIVLPYLKGDEVRGVAKIFNADAAEVMQTTHRSTSPGVTPPKGSSPVLLEQGTDASSLGTDAQATKILDEGLPLILDHLAVCEAGVWDKDGPPDGIRLDALSRKDASVTEEEKKALEAERDDARKDAAEAKEKLDAFEKADKARKDAEESDKEAMAAAEKEKADKAKKDAADPDDDARKDGESDEEFEKRKADKAKNDAAAAAKTPVDADRGTELHDSVTAMQALIKRQGEQLAALTAQPSIEDSNEIAKAWGRWDSLYQSLGDPTPASYLGEKPRAYLRRLADGVRKYTQSFANYAFHDSQQATDFGLVADAIYAEATAHAKKPAPYGTISDEREIITHPHGKTRTEFQGGDPFLPFKHSRKFAVTAITRPTAGNVYGN